ncbi:MAG: peroxiredoxin family protein, partial [Alphaproteobacteria bacterium]
TGAPRTSSNMPLVLAAAIVGVVLAVVEGTLLQVDLAVLCFFALLAYDFWYSRFGRKESAALTIGNKLPTFVMEDADGNEVTADNFKGAPAIFMFFRGNWCPLCMAQIKEVADRYNELETLGAKMVLVAPQSHKNTQELAERFKVNFTYLCDPENRAAKALGIEHLNGTPMGIAGYDADTVLPTVIVVDADGTILMADQTDNYRVRPEPDTFLNVLKEAAAV